MIGALPRLHELAQQAGIELPHALGKVAKSTGDSGTTVTASPSDKSAKHDSESKK
jgi:hypothetical protein